MLKKLRRALEVDVFRALKRSIILLKSIKISVEGGGGKNMSLKTNIHS